MDSSPLKPEFEYYVANQKKLAERYAGKFLVIKGQKVIAVFEREFAAIRETQKEHERGTFFVQKVDAAGGDYPPRSE